MSDFDGKLDKLTVKFGVKDARISVGDSAGSNAKIGSINIGGSLIGGAGESSGEIFANTSLGESNGKLAGVSIGGSVLGGSKARTGVIYSDDDMGP